MKKILRGMRFAILLGCILFCTAGVASAEDSGFEGGDGSRENPYQIATKEQLWRALENKQRDDSYILLNDLFFTEEEFQEGGAFYNGGRFWDGIGGFNYYQGDFNGNGHTIKGLKMKEEYGFINDLDSKASVRNLYLEDVYKMKASGGVITHYNRGTIQNCYVSGVIDGTQRGGNLGAIAGVNKESGRIGECYNSADIQAGSSTVGGIAARNSGGKIENCYNIGNVLLKCSESDVWVENGGIVGATKNGTIKNCMNLGFLNLSHNVLPGGIAGESDGTQIINCYSISNFTSNELGEKLDLEQLREKDVYKGFDFTDVWCMDSESTYPFPYLNQQGQPVISRGLEWESGGNGTNIDPYIIKTTSDLDRVREALTSCFVLERDLNFSDSDFQEGGAFFNDGKKWIAIGDGNPNYTPENYPFVGKLDGNGKTIRGIHNQRGGGVFAVSEGTIQNLSIEEFHIEGVSNAVGCFAGANRGLIEFCNSKSDLSVTCESNYWDDVGGIASYNYGTIRNCTNTGDITNLDGDTAGGIVGTNYEGKIENCWNSGKISAAIAGGIIGYERAKHSVQNVFNCGNVGGGRQAGGIIGDLFVDNEEAHLLNAYNIGCVGASERSGAVTVTDNRATNYVEKNSVYVLEEQFWEGASLMSEREAKLQKNYEGFDFGQTWILDTECGYPYPYLKGMELPDPGNTSDLFEKGKGTLDDPYCISSKEELNHIREDSANYFLLTENLEFTNADFEEGGDYYNDGSGWIPISNERTKLMKAYHCGFNGVMNGNNKVIAGIRINAAQYGGVFYHNDGVIHNLDFYNIETTGSCQTLGTIAGTNSGRISDCSAYGTIIANKSENSIGMGGITGNNSGEIVRCSFTGTIKFYNEPAYSRVIGGIVDYNAVEGLIKDCYAQLEVKALETYDRNHYWIGGIARKNVGAIDCVYSACDFSEADSAKNSWGISDGAGSIEHAYFLYGEPSGTNRDKQLTSEEMKQKESYQGFDFENTWDMLKSYKYPKLRGRSTLQLQGLKFSEESYLVSVNNDVTTKIEKQPACSEVNIQYTVSDESKITVNEDGVLTGKAEGEAVLTATDRISGNSNSVKVTIERIHLTDFYISYDNINSSGEIELENTAKINTRYSPENASDKELSYGTLDEAIAVTQRNTVIPVSPGETKITARHESLAKEKTLPLKVYKKTEDVKAFLNGRDVTEFYTDRNTPVTLTAKVAPEDGNRNFQFTTSDWYYAGINKLGEVNPKQTGKVTLSVKNTTSEKKDTIELQIIDSLPETLEADDIQMKKGESQKLEYTFLPKTPPIAPDIESSDPDIAVVDKEGNIEAVNTGTTTITIRSNGADQLQKKVKVTVTEDIPYSIRFHPNGGSGTMPDMNMICGQEETLIKNRFTRAGHTFRGWSFTPNGKATMADGETVKDLAADKGKIVILYAQWDVKSYRVKAVSEGSKKGRISGTGTKAYETKAVLTAKPQKGHRFVKWVEGDRTVSTNYQYSFYVTEDRTLKAVFAEIKRPKVTLKPIGRSKIKVKYTSVSGAYQYQIYRSAKRNKGYKLVKTVSSSQKSWTNKKLKRNKKYYYKVRVKCKAGNIYTYSEFSRIKSKRVKKY